MKIVKVTKIGLFYKVKFDNDEVFKFHESVIVAYGFIRKNIEVSQVKLNKALEENEYFIALDKAINYLTTLRSRKEVLLYLKKNYEKDIVNKVMSQLEKLNLINDKEYALYFVDVMKKKAYGRYKIINDLKELEILEEYIDIAISNYEYDIEIDNCEKQFIKYIPSLKKDSKASSKRKIVNYLINKGFSNEIITIVLEKNREKLDNISNEDELLIETYHKLLKTKKGNIKDKKYKEKIVRSLCNKGFPLSKILKLLE